MSKYTEVNFNDLRKKILNLYNPSSSIIIISSLNKIYKNISGDLSSHLDNVLLLFNSLNTLNVWNNNNAMKDIDLLLQSLYY